MSWWARGGMDNNRQRRANSFCKCFHVPKTPESQEAAHNCRCGEHTDVTEWQWHVPNDAETSWMVMSSNNKQVTFHPHYSSGTAVVRGDTPLLKNHHYYWEIKMLTEPYGTDITIGLGTLKVDCSASRYRFTSVLGEDSESYGLSYSGVVRHEDRAERDGAGFCRGTIIGVKVDLWQGTIEFFLNRKSRGISFYNLRRHEDQTLYPMISSTAAQSAMRLIYASSWQASLLVDSAKILGASVTGDMGLPPGLLNSLKNNFWLTLPNEGCIVDERDLTAVLNTSEDAAPFAQRPDIYEYGVDDFRQRFEIAIQAVTAQYGHNWAH